MLARLVDRALIADRTMAFWFQPEGPFTFTPGQTCDITIPDPIYRDDLGNVRTFSIASVPSEPRLMFATRLGGSAFKRTLAEAPTGLAVDLDGPYGSFTLHHNITKPAVFLAGGIGITPFHSIIGDLVARAVPRSITLICSNRRKSDVPWLPDLQAWADAHSHFRLFATLTASTPDDDWRHERGRVDKAFLAARLDAVADTIFYAAGPARFVAALQALLPEVGADPDNIRTEEFPGY